MKLPDILPGMAVILLMDKNAAVYERKCSACGTKVAFETLEQANSTCFCPWCGEILDVSTESSDDQPSEDKPQIQVKT